ncbi:hypothetical protein ACYSNW_00850 [Enterococcus sp. LJL99]
MESKLIIVAILFLISLIIVIFGYVIKQTNGLFLSRLPNDFKTDRYNPEFEYERKIGNKISKFILKWIVPISLGLFILMVAIFFKYTISK